MIKTEQVVVARAEVADEVHVDGVAPDGIRVPAGTTLFVKFPFHFVEASRDKETYTFTLEARLGSEAPDPVRRVGHDRPGIKDELQGTLQQRFTLQDPGEYDLTFRAEAHYGKGPWTGEGDEHETAVGVEGVVRVIVV